MNSLFLGMSGWWGIGGIQLTQILLSWWFASYSVVNYKKLVCILVFCREEVWHHTFHTLKMLIHSTSFPLLSRYLGIHKWEKSVSNK